METFLITGYSGFVGYHFLQYLTEQKVSARIIGVDIHEPELLRNEKFPTLEISFHKINLLDSKKLEELILQSSPDYVLHLASYSSVAFSWQNPILSFQNNTNIFLNLVEAVKRTKKRCRILSVGSSEEYGNISNPEELPLKEDHLLNPLSPYAVARVSQELLSKVYCNGYGVDIIMTRSFNHIGPYQKDVFVIPSFVKQMVEIKEGGKNEMEVGDLSIIRDFTDVRDVVNAYYLLLKHGKSGGVYNVCSGKGFRLSEITDILSSLLKLKIKLVVNQNRIRPDDNKIIIGSNDKIKQDTGWVNKIAIDESLRDMITYWQRMLG